jgi:hypothetical protein
MHLALTCSLRACTCTQAKADVGRMMAELSLAHKQLAAAATRVDKVRRGVQLVLPAATPPAVSASVAEADLSD